MALNGLLDGFDGQVALSAGRAALVPTQAVEVGIEALRQGEAQPAAAVPTEDAALEVVVVDPRLLPRDVVGLEHGLHAVVHRRRHQGLVAALVLDALEGHVAEVVAVRQHVRHV